MTNKRRLKYATDPEYRQKELERVAKAKRKKDFIEWQRAYNREYYHRIRKEKMRNNSKVPAKRMKKVVEADTLVEILPEPSPINIDDFGSSGSEDEITEPTPVNTEPQAVSPQVISVTSSPQQSQEIPVPLQSPIIVKTAHPSSPARTQVFSASTPYDEMQKRVNTQADICAMLNIEVEFKCKLCSMRFSSLEPATIHAKTHQKMQYECGLCQQQFNRLPLLMGHIQKEHGESTQATTSLPSPSVSNAISKPPPAKASVIKSMAQEGVKLSGIQEKDKARGIVGRQITIKRVPARKDSEVVEIAKKTKEAMESSKNTRRISSRQSARIGRTQQLLQESIKEALEDYEEVDDRAESPTKSPKIANDKSIVYSCPCCSVSFLDENYYKKHTATHFKEWDGALKRKIVAGPKPSSTSEIVYVVSDNPAGGTDAPPNLEPIKYIIDEKGHLLPIYPAVAPK